MELSPLHHNSNFKLNYRASRKALLCLLVPMVVLVGGVGFRALSSSSDAPIWQSDVGQAQLHHVPSSGEFTLSRGGEPRLRGWLHTFTSPSRAIVRPRDGSECFELTVPAEAGVHFSIASGGWWYGGPELATTNWPLNPTTVERQKFISADFLANKAALGSVLEATWLTSSGASLRVVDGDDFEMSLNVHCEGEAMPLVGKLCLFPTSRSQLVVEMCAHDDVRAAHLALLERLPRPTHSPSTALIREPIWSTWARYKMDIDQPQVEAFAEEIAAYGFPRSHMEIDDRWSRAYGDFVFDSSKFPDPAAMVKKLHALNFSVTVWVIPFANPDSLAYAEGAKLGHWMRDADGTPTAVRWWQGSGALLNVSDPSALDWFEQRLRLLMETTGVDGFKFDAGEGQFVPPFDPRPSAFAGRWARFAARFGAAGEVRAAHASQDAAIWVREFDKESHWDASNGLQSLVTTALQMGVLGYPWVLPDMVGGNAYNEKAVQPAAAAGDAKPAPPNASGSVALVGERDRDGEGSFWFGAHPDEELYVRWCLANALLPAVQFSISPWQYGAHVVDACRHALELRSERLPLLEALSREALKTGYPIVRPLWWHCPVDPICQVINDAFMVGDTTLVAPVLQPGWIKRDIYIPEGRWIARTGLVNANITGPTWLHNYMVPLEELAIFEMVG